MAAIDDYIRDLATGDFDARKIAASQLGESRDVRAFEPLLAALEDESWSIQAAAIRGLGHLYVDVPQVQAHRERIISSVLPFMSEQRPGLLINTIRTLGWMGAEEAVDAIVMRLNDQDSDVRGEAIKTLGALGNKSVVPHFIAIVRDVSRGKWDRVWAVSALGNLGDSRAVEPLIAALSDGLPEVRHAAIVSLVQLGDARAVELVRALLKDVDDEVRFQAIQAAVAFKDTQALPTLRVMSHNDAGWGQGQPMSKRAGQAVRKLTRSQNNPAANVAMDIRRVVKGIGHAITMPVTLYRRRKELAEMFGPSKNKKG